MNPTFLFRLLAVLGLLGGTCRPGQAQSPVRCTVCLRCEAAVRTTPITLHYANTVLHLSAADTCLPIRLPHAGPFRVQVSGLAIVPVEVQVHTDSLATGGRLTLLLREQVRVLHEVAVRSRRPDGSDTLVLVTDSVQVMPHSNAAGLVEKLPGVSLSQDGRLTVMGKPVDALTVDGKTWFGGNAKATLEALKADMIKQLEVVNLSGAAGGQTSVNVRLKDDRKQGWYGQAGLTAGIPAALATTVRLNRIHPKGLLNVFWTANTINESAVSPETENRLLTHAFTNGLSGAHSLTERVEDDFLKPPPRRFQLFSLDELVGRNRLWSAGLNANRSGTRSEWFGFMLLSKTRQYMTQETNTVRLLPPYQQVEQQRWTEYNDLLKGQAVLTGTFKLSSRQTLRFSQGLYWRQAGQELDRQQAVRLLETGDLRSENRLRQAIREQRQEVSLTQQALWIYRHQRPGRTTSLYANQLLGNAHGEQTYHNQLTGTAALTNHNRVTRTAAERSWAVQAVHALPLTRQWLLEGKATAQFNRLPLRLLAEGYDSTTLTYRQFRPALSLPAFSSSDLLLTGQVNALFKSGNWSVVGGAGVWQWTGRRQTPERPPTVFRRSDLLLRASVRYRQGPLIASVRYYQAPALPGGDVLPPVADSANVQQVQTGNSLLTAYAQRRIDGTVQRQIGAAYSLLVNVTQSWQQDPVVAATTVSANGLSGLTFVQALHTVLPQSSLSLMWLKIGAGRFMYNALLVVNWQETLVLTNDQPVRTDVRFTMVSLNTSYRFGPQALVKVGGSHTLFSNQANRQQSQRVSLSGQWEHSFHRRLHLSGKQEVVLGKTAQNDWVSRPNTELALHGFLFPQNWLRLSLQAKNLFNTATQYTNHVTANVQSEQLTNQLPRLWLFGLTAFPEKWGTGRR